jgi:hypothetical protein
MPSTHAGIMEGKDIQSWPLLSGFGGVNILAGHGWRDINRVAWWSRNVYHDHLDPELRCFLWIAWSVGSVEPEGFLQCVQANRERGDLPLILKLALKLREDGFFGLEQWK